MLERDSDDKVGNEKKCDHKGSAERERQGSGAVLGGQRAAVIAEGDEGRHFPEQHRASGDNDNAARQLIKPVGVADGGETAGRQERADNLVGERADLIARRNADRRPQHPKKFANIGGPARPSQPLQEPAPARVGDDNGELRRAGGEKSPARHAGHARRGLRKKGGEGEKRNHAHIGGRGRRSRGSPGIVGVERALMEREDGDEGDIGEHDARHRDRLRELLGLADKAGRSQPHQQRHVEIDEAEQRDLRQDEQREDLAREMAGLLGASGLEHARVGQQISGVERPFAEDLAELVGRLIAAI